MKLPFRPSMALLCGALSLAGCSSQDSSGGDAAPAAQPDASAQKLETYQQLLRIHNDEMAVGAIAAVEAAGRTPGKDVIIVSVDGTRDALQAIIDGKMGATVECNPKFGPAAFTTLDRYARGEAVEPWVINEDRFFDRGNAAAMIADAY